MRALKWSPSWTLYALVAITAAAMVFGVYRSLQRATATEAAVPRPAAEAASLVSLRPSVDLGTVSMAAGKVPFRYLIKNAGAQPLNITRVSTSCMCTTAMLLTATELKGPFGMPGHGRPNATHVRLAPGEQANVEAVFDPAAHGPSGLGRIERVITLESAEAPPLELRMAVLVRP